jgi:hypothetical protein
MISAGKILFEDGTALPESFRLESEAYPSSWMSMKSGLNAYDIEKQIKAAGWNFFYMAGQLSTSAFGFDRRKMIHSALKQIIAKVKLQKCNCLEIDDVTTHSFLGMPYLSITGHSRHIQKGPLFAR